jgi:ABC-type transport system involved in cytochrome c biogenesis permease component
MPRLDKVRTLLEREILRLFKNPSALMLMGMLVAFSILLVLSRNDKKPKMVCWIVYPDQAAAVAADDRQSKFVSELTERAEKSDTIKVVPMSRVPRTGRGPESQRIYPPSTCAIELLSLPTSGDSGAGLSVAYRHPGAKSDVLEPFLRWFWPVAVDYFGKIAVTEQAPVATRPTSAAAVVMEKLQSGALGDLMNEDLAAAILLLIIQFVTCCQLIVSFTSQDRERGTLAALALSPITMSELLQAKILFHLGLSVIGSAAVIAVLKPLALTHLSLWITLFLTGLGLASVGMVIASLTKTQSSASLLALCYMLIGAVVFYLATKFSAFATLKSFSFEHYSFGLVYVSLQKSIPLMKAVDLRPMFAIVAVWLVTATLLFRSRGWR